MDASTPFTEEKHSDTVYADALAEMYDRTQMERPAGDTDRALSDRRQDLEFLLSIRYRLGQDFPVERTRLMLVAHRAMRAEFRKITKNFLARIVSGRRHTKRVQALMDRLMIVFQSILTPVEYEAFTGLKPNESSPVIVELSLITKTTGSGIGRTSP